MDDTKVIDLAAARQRREEGAETALLALFSGVLGKPLARRELTPEQMADRAARAAHRREQRRDRLATAAGESA